MKHGVPHLIVTTDHPIERGLQLLRCLSRRRRRTRKRRGEKGDGKQTTMDHDLPPVPPPENTPEDVLAEGLKDPVEAAGYLNACLEDGDPEVFLLALRDIARAQGGVAKLAEITELNREHLYRMLSENGNPELRSLETLLDALGFRLAVTLKEAS